MSDLYSFLSPSFPKLLMTRDGFYLEVTSRRKTLCTWRLKRLLDDNVYATVVTSLADTEHPHCQVAVTINNSDRSRATTHFNFEYIASTEFATWVLILLEMYGFRADK